MTTNAASSNTATPGILFLRGGTVLCHNEHDQVKALSNTDILIIGDTIVDIGQNLDKPAAATEIDCRDKIVSPGFVNTHHHLWQTQLKARYADHTFIDYMPAGNFQSHSYNADDMFWGQLGGCLEAIDSGTTFVLDHMHAGKTREHASQALLATEVSGLRAVFAYAFPWFRFQKWDQTECLPEEDIMPEWVFSQIEEWLKDESLGDGRVQIGFGFDFYFLPDEVLQGVFARVRKAGVKLITSHAVDNEEIGMRSPVKKMEDAGLLGPDIVLSHCNRLDVGDLKTLHAHGIYVSSTPETEGHMGLSWPMALEHNVNGSIGIDTHACGPSSVLGQARSLLLLGRQQSTLDCIEKKKFPRNMRGNSEQVFNLATIEGARAIGMGDRIGKIAKGYLADLVIFNTTSPSMLCASQFDPLVAVLRHSDVRDIDTVVINGQIRKQGGKLLPIQLKDGTHMSYDEIGKNIVQSQRDILERIDQVNLEKGRELLLGLLHITEDNFQGVD